MTEPNVVGNLAELGEGQILLPSFIVRKKDGLHVDLLAVDSRNLMLQFAERVFASRARFADLDYEVFLNLVFLWEPADIERQAAALTRKGKPPLLRLARDIVPFPEERRGIYRGVKILGNGKSAEYIFEQVSVERTVDDLEAPDGSGRRRIAERLYADFDEFVAAAWEKGVRFGIDARVVREAIARDNAERTVIAQLTVPTEGRDAGIDEQTDLLHRDDTPRILANGRIDLRHYRNRFPQVKAGTRLFKKIPRVPGVSGWDIHGKELLPAAVKDFDIETLAGVGTRVVRDGAELFVIAAQDGFLDIDAQSNQVSVIHKIVNREGISMRTTGDLYLEGDDFEEHGDVQEKRVVEGHNMIFLADVFGNVVSDGGRVAIRQNISGGTARSPGGSIVVEGFASRALLEARGGEVDVSRAEGSTFIADRVRIERAVKCDIVAEEVEIESAEGCAIAARKVSLKTSAARKGEGTTVAMLLPDLANFDIQLKRLEELRGSIAAESARHEAALQALLARTEMKSYLAIQSRLKAKTLAMSPAQRLQWDALQKQLAPALQQAAALNEAIRQARENAARTDEEIESLRQARGASGEGIACTIGTVAGDTRVHTLRIAFDAPPLASLAPKALHARLHAVSSGAASLFSGSSGSFEWQASQQKG